VRKCVSGRLASRKAGLSGRGAVGDWKRKVWREVRGMGTVQREWIGILDGETRLSVEMREEKR